MTAHEISARVGLPRATTYRLLNLLVQHEYLVRLADLSGFALGAKVGDFAAQADRGAARRDVARIVADVRTRVRGGVHLADLSGHRVRVTDVDPDFPLSDPHRIVSDLSCSAWGRLILAETTPAARTSPYALQVGELVPGFGCFAAAVHLSDGRLVAGLALALPAVRLEDPVALWELVADSVTQIAAALEPGP